MVEAQEKGELPSSCPGKLSKGDHQQPGRSALGEGWGTAEASLIL